ncbi:CMGC family protein kinase [Tritrichomonas foetus]|uniref:CMGC family protein kinase n=1 Tax=Tritrichomonas foetus TaxID=1144522 RepID=A0A1J4K9E2_9EUKA|nr:CMGC family protein kinase [Tritrichomonas foetus]|eukprot:OHT06294.1 CMGC family protein kinase [Tritrichomonas foetus]
MKANPRRASIIIKVPKNSPRMMRKPMKLPEMVNHENVEFLDLSEVAPVKPSYITVNYSDFLTAQENTEINSHKEIYYIRKKRPIHSKQNRIGNFFKFTKEEHIAYRYEQISILGQGAFGNVINCIDHKTHEKVAIKMLRDKPKLHSQVLFELKLLMKLQGSDYIINYIESFQFRGFFCIVMELLGKDVYSVLADRKFLPFPKHVIQNVARETTLGLKYMHSTGIIHCDIKPENILFFENNMNNVKIIDFGCSCYVGKLMYSYIQSRYYRAPEVVFGIQYSTPIDMWSLGCVICELLTGTPLFPAEDENELVNQISEVIGLPPKELIKKGPRAKHYFNEDGTLKNFANTKGKKYEVSNKTLRDLAHIKDNDLLDLVEKCLTWDPKERITPDQFLLHPWINKEFNL